MDIDEVIDDDSPPEDLRSIVAALNATKPKGESTTPKRLVMSPGLYLALLKKGLKL